MAEMLVVLGIIALLIAMVLPSLRHAHRQAKATACAAQEQQIGVALESTRSSEHYYPVWDDGGSPTRYTWVDVLVQRRMLGNQRVAYCPEDAQPSFLNSDRARHYGVRYPNQPDRFGVDYSYGISTPLASAGWIWQPGYGPPNNTKKRRLEGYQRYPGQRVLVTDAAWPNIYNLSGTYLAGHGWSYPTVYDNTVEWRHPARRANLLFQDGHVEGIRYQVGATMPVNTVRQFVWYPDEPLTVGPGDRYNGNYYPNAPPVDAETGEGIAPFPSELVPSHYTNNLLWTRIPHK